MTFTFIFSQDIAARDGLNSPSSPLLASLLYSEVGLHKVKSPEVTTQTGNEIVKFSISNSLYSGE